MNNIQLLLSAVGFSHSGVGEIRGHHKNGEVFTDHTVRILRPLYSVTFGRPSLLDKTSPGGFKRGFRSRVDVQFSVNLPNITRCGVVLNFHEFCDSCHGVTFGNEL